MGNKNNAKTLNERTHNPFETYKHLHQNTTSHQDNPEDNTAEIAEEFDSKVKNKNNATNHDKTQKSNKNK
ncbi:hypothetical protein CD30_00555 [Ureibacillus massiliensis 4400831 = CIP 108448 = CCUG 49529]|uniref:Uncharacterized protein n=1 Tax=Ureibacillus massiliensis 4400831 = CIP 108448 = CCUG 49529 TaxID=1211035 RepID=A0A0A3JB06_9BACL|nr:hypothetical protein [Ureibacillus massiliensis]KGR92343.1 hypothetical protein CD30_00555 [Ureibacillus massiliensis 4400831 = CIP 108448 = CCUG 49529]